jgi:Neutral/alkaline non-lysosomal ceramidase, N-terminal
MCHYDLQSVAALGRVLALTALVVWPRLLQHGFSAEFRAGAAKAKITPEELGWLGGYSHRNRPAEGVAADLWTRALAVEDKQGHRRVLVSTDIHIFTRELHREIADAVRKRHGLEERDLMLFATHTHNGPALPRGFDPGISWGLNEEEMRKLRATSDRVRDQTLDAIARALSDLQPARLSFGRGKAAFGVNRRMRRDDGSYDFGSNPAGVADPDVPVLFVESTKGAPRAVVFTYACHCTSIRNGQEGFYKYHPDYAGITAEQVERQLPGSTALYATGCAGDIDPQPQGGVKQAEQHGQALSAVVLGTLNRAQRRQIRGPLRTTYREIALPLATIPSRQKYVELSGSRVSYRQRHARYVLTQMDAGTLPKEVPFPIQVWRFGKDLTLVALSGEVVVDYALRLKKELGADRTWPVAYANEVPCYIPSERILKEGGYEAGWDSDQGPGVPGATSNVLFYGWSAPLASGVEERVMAAVHSLVKQ